jgi:hypothetical protein
VNNFGECENLYQIKKDARAAKSGSVVRVERRLEIEMEMIIKVVSATVTLVVCCTTRLLFFSA